MFEKLTHKIRLWSRFAVSAIVCRSNQQFYDRISDIYDEVFVEHEQHAQNIAYLLEQSLTKKDKVLDLGCGTGLLSNKLATIGFDVIGVDISYNSLALLQKRYPDVAVLNADATHLPFKKQSFCAVVSLGAWRHFPNAQQVIASISDILSDDGILIIGYFPPSFAGLFHQRSSYVIKFSTQIYEYILTKLGYVDQISPSFESDTLLLIQEYFHSVQTVESGKHWHLIVARQPNHFALS